MIETRSIGRVLNSLQFGRPGQHGQRTHAPTLRTPVHQQSAGDSCCERTGLRRRTERISPTGIQPVGQKSGNAGNSDISRPIAAATQFPGDSGATDQHHSGHFCHLATADRERLQRAWHQQKSPVTLRRGGAKLWKIAAYVRYWTRQAWDQSDVIAPVSFRSEREIAIVFGRKS